MLRFPKARKTFAVLLPTTAIFSTLCTAMTLPAEDARWKRFAPDFDIQYDTQTFKASPIDDGPNKGQRWVNAWVRYIDPDSNLETMMNLAAVCPAKTLFAISKVVKDTKGKQTMTKGYGATEIDIYPGSSWEPVVFELCKRAR